MLNETIEYLNLKTNGKYLDCTFGRGGHSKAILEKLNAQNSKLYAIDQDPTSISEGEKLMKISNNFHLIEGNFSNLTALLALQGEIAIDGILFDLGVSSPQLDVSERGFSYRFDGPLDMRMDYLNNSITASDVINQKSESEIVDILLTFGEEKQAKTIAKAIVAHRPLKTTLELVQVIKEALPQHVLRQKGHPAKKTFQALRIYVNNELDNLASALEQSLKLLASKGRLVVITFHSLEEKIVKKVFKTATLENSADFLSKLPLSVPEQETEFRLIIKKPIKPTHDELTTNFRAHSAKMWVIEKR